MVSKGVCYQKSLRVLGWRACLLLLLFAGANLKAGTALANDLEDDLVVVREICKQVVEERKTVILWFV